MVVCSYNPLTYTLMDRVIDILKSRGDINTSNTSNIRNTPTTPTNTRPNAPYIPYILSETLRSHHTKPGLLVNTDMQGQHKSIYGARSTNNSNNNSGGDNSSSIVNNSTSTNANANVNTTTNTTADATEVSDIEHLIQECVVDLQQSMRACIKMEKVYIDKVCVYICVYFVNVCVTVCVCVCMYAKYYYNNYTIL